MKNIVLIGMMGSGKTTISKILAEKLERPVIDIDEYLVQTYNMTIPEMFLISEDYFRERESLCCQELGSLENHIISTGGGVIKNPDNIKSLKENGILIYLDRPIPNILEDVDVASRPLLKDGPDQLYQLYKERHQVYLDVCDYHIHNEKTLEDVAHCILKIIQSNK